MKLNQAILTLMDRDTLKAVVDDLDIEGVDRRSVEDMRAKISRSRRAEVELLLAHLSEKQVKAVCEQQAAAKGDVRFFELAYLEAEIQKPVARPGLSVKKGDPAVQVALKDFVIPNTELIPEEVRSKIKKWSDYIDYWAVDWNFQNDTSQAFDVEVPLS